MAKRPVFIPKENSSVGVNEHLLEFEWSPGMAKVQKQKSIMSLHKAASEKNISPILEISSKSEEDIGVKLSAFNLMITTRNNRTFSVETAFQSSKVFEHGGPFIDLCEGTSLEAKKDLRLKDSGNLIRFRFFGTDFPINPKTFFYDWLYINALNKKKELADEVMKYKGFTDIEFNPKKSINCQAYSVALFTSLKNLGLLEEALASQESFKEILKSEYSSRDSQILIQGKLI